MDIKLTSVDIRLRLFFTLFTRFLAKFWYIVMEMRQDPMRKKKVRSKFLIVIPFQEVSFRWNNRGANIYVPLSLSASKLTYESRFLFPPYNFFLQIQTLRLFSQIETILSNIKNHMSFLWWLQTSQSLIWALKPIPDTQTIWSWG